MTARDLLNHVFPWELTTGVERLDAEESEVSEAVLETVLETASEPA